MINAKRLSLALLGLVVVATIALVWLLGQGRDGDDAGEIASADSARAAVASEAVKQTVREAATEAATRVYGYAWDSLAEDRAAAQELLTGDMIEQYDRSMAGVGTSSRPDRTVVEATVVDTALVHATSSYARVLVFVNQTTDSDALDEPRINLDRVLVTLERDGETWKVSELDAL